MYVRSSLGTHCIYKKKRNQAFCQLHVFYTSIGDAVILIYNVHVPYKITYLQSLLIVN